MAKAGLDFDRLNQMVDKFAVQDYLEQANDSSRH
jgi:hypothetical protein